MQCPGWPPAQHSGHAGTQNTLLGVVGTPTGRGPVAWAPHVVQGKESTLQQARDSGDVVSIPGLGRSPGGGHGIPLPGFLPWRIPWTEEPGGLQSTGLAKNQTRLSDQAQHSAILAPEKHERLGVWAGEGYTSVQVVHKGSQEAAPQKVETNEKNDFP